MKIPRKYANLLYAVLMSVAISGTISFILTAVQRGLGSGFLGAWLMSVASGFAIALPVSLIAAKPLRKLVELMTEPED